MKVVAPRETAPGERRVAIVPEVAKQLAKAGLELAVEAGAGLGAGAPDEAYERAGVRVVADRAALLGAADLVLQVQPPDDTELALLRPGSVLVSFLRPLDEPARAARLAERGITSFAMELVPRITRAQAIDALSSQASLAGYRAVLLAALALGKVLPMMTTAAGTIAAARLLVIGAGVAGLQAIATARRLGAVTEAYDTRPAVKEQVESLGARFLALPLDTSGAEGAGGYAKAQSDEFLAKQRALLSERVRAADAVITTAQVPGARAPLLIEAEVVAGMKPGAVIVDLAAAGGGNCALTRADETVVAHGVTILGPTNLPSDAAVDASRVYARNLANLVALLVKDGALTLDLEDEVVRGSLLTHEGRVVAEAVRARLGS
ncbi:MAG: Re/Si-specific NAD(P)(+) transhydrogenase subunit alpha [Deltaproteobacteria bacterium]|nr:Re/Si-specific NAD(P)(+) transhydrogenase subunit alpha [Deltaproteobacteria bacterium]